jgi:hypothetical protein
MELSYLKAIEKWNDILPQMTGGGTVPFIGIGETAKKNRQPMKERFPLL